MIGDAIDTVVSDPEAARPVGWLLLAAGVLLCLLRLALGMAVARRSRRRRTGSVAAPQPRRLPAPAPFAPRLDDSTQVHRALADRTEVFPAPWGARRG